MPDRPPSGPMEQALHNIACAFREQRTVIERLKAALELAERGLAAPRLADEALRQVRRVLADLPS